MKSIIQNPIVVTIVSLIVAIAIGIFAYVKINAKVPTPVVPEVSSVSSISSTPEDLTLGFLSGGRIATVSVKAGDTVKKGAVLATLDAGNTVGALNQAKAAYQTAEANYQKIINGATGSAIDVAKAAVNTAQVNLNGVSKQQATLVANAQSNLLNSTIVAKSDLTSSLPAPTITGTYTKTTEGTITLTVNQGGSNGGFFSISGMFTGTGIVSTTTPEPILDTGLYIEFPAGSSYVGTTWNIDIPNTTAANYLANYNAYQAALQAQTQAVSNAQAALDQANASLAALATAARPEDVAAAQAQVNNAEGAVEIAEAAYENTIITAPADGTVVSVAIAPGQIATTGAPAIEFKTNGSAGN